MKMNERKKKQSAANILSFSIDSHDPLSFLRVYQFIITVFSIIYTFLFNGLCDYFFLFVRCFFPYSSFFVLPFPKPNTFFLSFWQCIFFALMLIHAHTPHSTFAKSKDEWKKKETRFVNDSPNTKTYCI